jgi:hypothetical protein
MTYHMYTHMKTLKPLWPRIHTPRASWGMESSLRWLFDIVFA